MTETIAETLLEEFCDQFCNSTTLYIQTPVCQPQQHAWFMQTSLYRASVSFTLCMERRIVDTLCVCTDLYRRNMSNERKEIDREIQCHKED